MTAGRLPENPHYCFAPVEDTEAGVHQIRIFVDGMAVAIPTALIVLTGDEAVEVADRLNARLGLDRAAWTALAAKCLRDGAGDPDGDTLH